MKRCPSCKREYPDDAPEYCPNDGMRLVKEEAETFDPEQTVISADLHGGGMQRVGDERPPAPPPTPPTSMPAPTPPTSAPTAPHPYAPEAAASDSTPPPQQWQPPVSPAPSVSGASPAPPPWSPAPHQPPSALSTPQPAQSWGSPFQTPAPAGAPYAPAQEFKGRSRALAIIALTTGACAVTLMAVLAVNRIGFNLRALLVLSIMGIVLGVAALILSLQKPSRFGGIPLAIIGLSLGTAGLVYYFTR